MNKYRAKKTTVGGITFDSRAEAARYCQLKALERDNKIVGLLVKPKYTFACGIKYTPDFAYFEGYGKAQAIAPTVEDVKGYVTRDSKMRAKLLKHERGIEVKFVKMKSSDVNTWLGIGVG